MASKETMALVKKADQIMETKSPTDGGGKELIETLHEIIRTISGELNDEYKEMNDILAPCLVAALEINAKAIRDMMEPGVNRMADHLKSCCSVTAMRYSEDGVHVFENGKEVKGVNIFTGKLD